MKQKRESSRLKASVIQSIVFRRIFEQLGHRREGLGLRMNRWVTDHRSLWLGNVHYPARWLPNYNFGPLERPVL